MVVYAYSDKNPGDFYLFDAKTAKVALLFSEKPEIDPEQMAAMQPVTITARDGVVLHGYLTVPAGSDGKNLPLIMNPHGGPHGIRDYWQFNPEAQFFSNHGYAFLQVNYRGSGGYGARFQDMGYRHWASTMQDDLADSVQWAVKQGIADPKRMCIYGASYGGYAAMESAVRYPDLYKCVVGYVGLYDLNLAEKHYAVENFASGKRSNYIYLGDDAKQLAADSPVNNADKLKASVFIIYGGQDKLVVPENASEMLSALDKAGKPHEAPLYRADEGHGFRKVENNIELYTRMLAFFDQYIGPDAAKTAPAPKP
jgi:dipeptidyl aminopeptidase/acylaminoacyl peptidase